MIIMPASGIAMGYYGGKGLPFFGTTFPGVVKTEENKKSTGAIAGQVRCGLVLDGVYMMADVCDVALTHSLVCLFLLKSFKIHKTVGTYGKYLIPLHAGAAVTHSLRGHAIFSRINPFGRPGY